LCTGGVEPAFILSKCPKMLGISIGPLMQNVHTPEERLNIKSTERFYNILLAFLPVIK
jgi:dipeptidase D